MPSLLVSHIFEDALKATLKNFAGFYCAFPVGGRLVVCVSVTEDREIPMPSEKPLAKRRRLAAQRVRDARDRLTSTTGTRVAFDYELMRQFAENRLSASLVVLLLICTVGFL